MTKDKTPEKGIKGFVKKVADGIEDAAEAAVRAVTHAEDKVEDAVEDGLGLEECDDDAAKRHHHHHHHYHAPVPATTPVNVTVNVQCKCCPDGKHGDGQDGPPTVPGQRPDHHAGTSDGSLSGGIAGIGGVINLVTRPPNVWPGTRSQLFLPLLFLRANAGDLGVRPVTGVFWESPDILIAPGVDPAHSPSVPDQLGGIAKANQDNTVYAHVWNLGQAPCPDTLVEFFWFNPSLGFGGDKANFIGATWVDLRARGEQGSHKLVRCPLSWRAQFLNGGHECLVVRVSQSALDPLSDPPWDSSHNRHVGQRNIHVMSAAEAAAKPTLPIAVGPMFGGAGQVAVARHATDAMQWLHLVTMDRNVLPGTGAATGDVGLTPPTPVGTPLPNLGAVPNARGAGLMGDSHGVTGDNQQVGFHATDGDPGAGNAHVYRVTGSQNGATFGGYTVVVVGG
jgi:hypothetical protein